MVTEPQIFILEDEAITAEDLRERVESLGYQVTGTFATGEKALTAAGKGAPDLALMDIRLAGELDGIETARRLRDEFDTPSVFISAFADDELLDRAKLVLPLGYLVKPISDRELDVSMRMALYTAGVERDREEHRRLLEQTRRDFEKAQEIAHVGSWSLDLVSGIAEPSPEHCRIYGVSPGADFTIDSFGVALHPDDESRVLTSFNEAIGGRVPAFELEHRITRPDGEVRHLHVMVETRRDPTGVPTRLFGVTQDITERKRLEAELLQARKMEAVGTLAGGVAHEINNVLAVVLGVGSLLVEDAPPGSQQHKDLRSIIDATESGKKLIGNLLGFARLGNYRRGKIDINAAVRAVLSLVRDTIADNIRVVERLEQDLGLVSMDANQVHQMIMNLCSNAVAALPNGGTITVLTNSMELDSSLLAAHPGVSPGRYVWVAVQDDGVGMDQEARERAFEPFFSTRAVGEGAGLGLSMVYAVVQNLAGVVKIDSEPGQGTTVNLYLPAL